MYARRYVADNSFALNATAILSELRQPFPEVPACSIYSLEVTHIAVEDQCLEGSDVVEQPSHAHHVSYVTLGSVPPPTW